MTELSYLWTTTGSPTGDQVASYTQADWAKILTIVAACAHFEGVAPDSLNAFALSFPSSETARVASGHAVVDGKPYENDGNEDLSIPAAVGGGNTRIDRIVLRTNWSAFTVRLTRIAGTDAASPTAPSITQTSGTTYDIPLYQVLVNTSGTVSLAVDEREWAAPLVDDSTIEVDQDDGSLKLVGTVPKLAGRQGGNASDWDDAGTTDYTPSETTMQAGVINHASGSSVSITFPTAFSATPIVVATEKGNFADRKHMIDNVTTTGFNLYAYDTAVQSSSPGGTYFWIAIGPT